jgi:cytochrome c-type biogenesis protein CcmF
MILVGTLYPLLADVLDMGKISVGPPYFSFFFVPITTVLMLFLGFAGFSRWRSTDGMGMLRKGLIPGVISVVLGLLLPALAVEQLTWSGYSLSAVVTLMLVFWVISMSLEDLLLKVGGKVSNLKGLTGSYWGMIVAHVGLAMCVLVVGLSASYDEQRDVRMVPGDYVELGDYSFQFVGVKPANGPNFTAFRGEVIVTKGDQLVTTLWPEKRTYKAAEQTMTEAAIDGKLHRDLYVSLGEPLGGDAWAIRAQVKPFVRCIWLGALMVALGGLIAANDKRYRRRKNRLTSAASAGGVAA